MFERLIGLASENTGPAALVRAASRFGMIPEPWSVVIRGLEQAPAPEARVLGGDWLENLDVMSHGLGCIVCGMYEDLTRGLTLSEIDQITPAHLEDLVPPGYAGQVLLESFDVCRKVHKEHGSVRTALESGLVKPEGLVTQALVGPVLRKRQKQGQTGSLLKRRLVEASNPEVSSLL